jgi:hypothetical protein
MSHRALFDELYRLWSAREFDAMLNRLPDRMMFFIPGNTRFSGDHDKQGFRKVLDGLATVPAHRQELVCCTETGDDLMAVFDNHIVLDGKETKYHSVHEWIFRDGQPVAFMLYVHEYEIFARVWA